MQLRKKKAVEMALVCSMERENIKHDFSTVSFLANYGIPYLNAFTVFYTGLFFVRQ